MWTPAPRVTFSAKGTRFGSYLPPSACDDSATGWTASPTTHRLKPYPPRGLSGDGAFGEVAKVKRGRREEARSNTTEASRESELSHPLLILPDLDLELLILRKINFCCLTHPVFGISSRQAWVLALSLSLTVWTSGVWRGQAQDPGPRPPAQRFNRDTGITVYSHRPPTRGSFQVAT